MTIFFNPFQDTSVFLSGKELGLGTSCFGPEAFLRDLELRSGLTCSETGSLRRAIEYRNALRKTCDAHPDIFYAESFGKDDLGTATVLLSWRDSLIRAGWRKGLGKGRKLEGFSLVEDNFSSPGSADRWRQMLGVLESRRILSPDDRVIVGCSHDDVDPFFDKVLSAIESKGTPVQFTDYKKLTVCPEIYSFENDIEAHKWLSSQVFSDDDVIAGADRALLNDMLYASGKATVGSYGEEIGSIMSLFSLGLSLFSEDVNAATLLAYLQIPTHPLGKAYLEKEYGGKKYRVSLRRELEKHLLRKSGMGEDWKKIIASATLDFEGKPLSEADLRETRLFINMWENTSDGKVAKSDVLAYTAALKKRASAFCNPKVDEERRAQYAAVVDYCNVLSFLLETEPDTIEVGKLSLWANRIVTPMEICGDVALKGSVNLVSSPVGVISTPRNIYWNHSVKRSEAAVPYEYQFLSKADIESVEGADFPPQDLRSRAERNMIMNALAGAAGKVVIIYGRKVAGEATVLDLVITEILQKFGLKKEKIEQKTNACGACEATVLTSPFGKAATHEIDPEKVKAFKPKHWSYSSVEELIQRPFDFYVNSILGLEGYGCADLQNIYQVKGNIAHHYVQYLAKECGNDIEGMATLHKSFDSLIGKVVEDYGIMLLQEEYALEYRSFRGVLKKSIDSLLSVMTVLGLSIVEVEKEFKDITIQPFGPFEAYIDCLLKDRQGKYVIFDFKWNEGDKYRTKLEDGEDLQLAFYRKIVEQEMGPVAYCGYYVFPSYTFLTTEPLTAVGVESVATGNPERDLFADACKAFAYRFDQLKNGIAEEATGMNITELDYTKAGMCPSLESYGGVKDNGWNGSDALKGGLK